MQSMPDMAALFKIAQSPAGQKLLSLLQGKEIDRITAAAAAGNYEEAKKMLAAALSSPESRDLMSQLEQQL